MANEVTYKQNGRTYILAVNGNEIDCTGCALPDDELPCPRRKTNGYFSCTFGDGKNHIWRETLPSKIIYPFRTIAIAIRDVFYRSASGQGRTRK